MNQERLMKVLLAPHISEKSTTAADQNRQFVSKGKQHGVRVELDLAEGQPHAYFNRSPWLEKTVASADRWSNPWTCSPSFGWL